MNKSLDKLRQEVIASFSTKEALESYVRAIEIGLWGSEKIMVDKYFNKGSRILDLGCGIGRTTIPLHRNGYCVIGVDFVPEMVSMARSISMEKGLTIDYGVGDATRLEFDDNSFDNIFFSFNGWTQIPGESERVKALNEIYRILKAGGHLILTTPLFNFWENPAFLVRQLARNFLLKPFGLSSSCLTWRDTFFSRNTPTQNVKNQYIHLVSPRRAVKLLTVAGFKVVEMSKRSEISRKDNNLGIVDCMFYVAKK